MLNAEQQKLGKRLLLAARLAHPLALQYGKHVSSTHCHKRTVRDWELKACEVRFCRVKYYRTLLCCRRVQWRAPVIQATGRLRLAERLSSGVLSCSALCRSGVRTKFGIDMVLLGEPGTTRSSKEGCTGPGRKRSRSKPPCRSVVGSRL